jgi:alpha-ribazole phosphatase
MRALHLIRHGRTEATERHLYCGSTDLPLTDLGFRKLTALRYSGEYPELTSDCKVYTSGMRRTEETLEILYGAVPHEVLPGLRELDFGVFEMCTYEELKDRADYQAWISGDNEQNVCPGGESGAQMRTRALAALEPLLAGAEDALIVTHGGIIASVMEAFFPDSGKSRYQWQPKPGYGYTLQIEEGRPVDYTPIPLEHWRGKSYAFVQNRKCEYFPCHEVDDPEKFNCLFCYCPLYLVEGPCGGACRYLPNGIKDCSSCTRPHDPENFGDIIGCFKAYCDRHLKKKDCN